ncbi:MAG: peptidase T [Peptoniphilaceae bacterium]|nr:peptidase T [Peptoniphilaceae bacterium]
MDKIVDRFLKYISYDTKSNENSNKKPSSEGQRILAKSLLNELGIEATINEESFVFGKLKSNSKKDSIPKIGFIAHLDTSPEFNGEAKETQIIKYNGGDIKLNDTITMKEKEFPDLKDMYGKTLITTKGNSLLGADDKAGIAEIMDALEFFVNNPNIEHGDILVAFTPDEEIGTGSDTFDVKSFGADFAYTLDGGPIGELEYECFNAASAKLKIIGKSVHPGTAKNVMLNSQNIAFELDNLLGNIKRPEHTEGYEGFYHLVSISGSVEETTMDYIIRSFFTEEFNEMKKYFKNCVEFLKNKYNISIDLEIKDTYYNMINVIEKNMEIVNIAKEAMENLDIKPIIKPIRGGTDGSKLSFMGLPTPNIFAGGHNMHGRYEFISIEDMKMASEVIKQIIILSTNYDK